jgi:hypothetical protein
MTGRIYAFESVLHSIVDSLATPQSKEKLREVSKLSSIAQACLKTGDLCPQVTYVVVKSLETGPLQEQIHDSRPNAVL